MTTFDRYDHLPSPANKAFADLEDFIGDLDGKTICTPADGGESFIDDGTIDADEAVKAFNTLVAAISPLGEPTMTEGMVDAAAKAIYENQPEFRVNWHGDREAFPFEELPEGSRRYRLRAARLALGAALRASVAGWQDISTAPKDGAHILAYAPKAPGHNIRTTWWRTREDGLGYVGWGEFNMAWWPPTHWMPVPAPPVAAPVAIIAEYCCNPHRCDVCHGKGGWNPDAAISTSERAEGGK